MCYRNVTETNWGCFIHRIRSQAASQVKEYVLENISLSYNIRGNTVAYDSPQSCFLLRIFLGLAQGYVKWGVSPKYNARNG